MGITNKKTLVNQNTQPAATITLAKPETILFKR